MEKKELIGYLKGIDTERRMGSLDYEYFADRKVVNDLIEEEDIHSLNDLIMAIESEILGKVAKRFSVKASHGVHFYFNCLDSSFDYDSTSEKSGNYANKLWDEKVK